MDREIEFRGRQGKDGKWHYGCLDITDGNYSIKEAGVLYPVDKESVGQYIGTTDKHGDKIYDGDIVSFIDFSSRLVGEIRYNETVSCFEIYVKHLHGTRNSFFVGHVSNIEIMGNSLDNFELLLNW